ncbi:MAG: hypothetical protein IPL65_12380 [Lewinellaceae bacterium]|nr:hypothetical protein [Lewinellaceae bacterium]
MIRHNSAYTILLFLIGTGLFCILLWRCHATPRVPQPAFYFWGTTGSLSANEKAYLDSLHCKRLYVKILDIGVDDTTGEPYPMAQLTVPDSSDWLGRDITPCIFLSNQVFRNRSGATIDSLASRVLAYSEGVLQKLGCWPLKRLQIDCDWSPSTQNAYFAFLNTLKKRLAPTGILSATIRLHQYKFPDQTGVPPVDRGMLMLYNTGDIDDWRTENSIFDETAASKYIKGAPRNYRLPLDLALPLFSWSLVYRNGDLWKIIPSLDAQQLSDTSCFTAENAYSWAVKQGTLREGHYLRAGDWIRRETISSERLLLAANWGAQLQLDKKPDIAFFQLSDAVVQQYPVQLLEAVCRKME